LINIEPMSTDYRFPNAEGDHTRNYLWQPVVDSLRLAKVTTVFDVGCGNGAFVRHLNSEGFSARGVDPSSEGVAMAKSVDANAPVEQASAYDPLAEKYGKFDAVVSLEVIGHVYYPRKLAKCMFDLAKPGGLIVVSTPYHGYWKNLVIAITGHFETHISPLWDNGIIKVWSVKTLTELFHETGAKRESVRRLGRIPVLAKTMMLAFRTPARSFE
jgi:2-polyprenyl-3-methyl-5-hydroxy-6-metoxy-1,4-benzoquinol methylase